MQEDMTVETLVRGVIELYRDRGVLYENMDREESADGVNNVLREIYKFAKA